MIFKINQKISEWKKIFLFFQLWWRQWVQIEMRKILFKHKKINFNCEGDETLAHWGCGVSTLGDTQNPTRQSCKTFSSWSCSQQRSLPKWLYITLWYKALLLDRKIFLSDEHFQKLLSIFVYCSGLGRVH